MKSGSIILHDKWKIIELINSGGQGKVYKVLNLKDDKNYALKLFHLKRFQEKKLKRVQTEINIIKKIDGGNNVIKIYDDNLKDVLEGKEKEAFYVMDYSRYGSLKDNDFYFNDVETTLRIFKEILIGVDIAHKAKIIHRDLKPENILLFPTQKNIVITDFGIGLLKDRSDEENVTEEEEIVGPLYFISPEQYKYPSKADEQSDIYSLGKVLLYLLTGKDKIFREEVGDLSSLYQGSNPYLPLIQETLLDKMVAEKKEERFANVEIIIEEVNQILEKISNNSQRYLQKKGKGPRIYELLIGSDKTTFVNNFTKDLYVGLKELEWGLTDLNKEGKHKVATDLIDELKIKYTDKRTQTAIDCVEKYINDPKELKKIQKEKGEFSFPHYYLSQYFFNNKSFKIAHQYIEKALEVETDPEIKLTYLLRFSEICKDCTCELKHNFDERLILLLKETIDGDMKSYLYKILGEHYIEIKNIRLGLLFLETYLSYEPFDEGARFTCAYQYAQIDESSSALHHYIIALNNSKDISGITNNLGVLYDLNNMPIKSMKMFEKSYSLGYTLAGSNIAGKYLKIGLKDKALELLREIIRENKSGYDKRVDSTLGSIEENSDKEIEEEKKMDSVGKLISKHNISFIEQLSSKSEFQWEGYWEINQRYAIQIVKDSDAYIVKPFNESNIKILGKFKGNCLEVNQVTLNETSYSSGSKYDAGFLYLYSENRFSGYIRFGTAEPLEIIALRIKDTGEYLEKHKSFSGLLAEAARRAISA